MTPPDVLDVPAAQAGGPIQLGSPEAEIFQVGQRHRMHYRTQARGHVYRVTVAPFRLTAVIEATEEGFVATAPELETMGYGSDPEAALTDLVEATQDYLSLLAESDTPLSPRIAHHARYKPLLHIPPGNWFASLIGIPRSAPDSA